MKTIILVGVPGCGKSSILREVARQFPSVSIMNYGDKMLEEAAREGLSRDELRKLPIPEQQKVGIAAARRMHNEGVTIIDTHALIRTPIGFCPGLPREVLEILKPRACVWIECTPETVLERRSKDGSRSRDAESSQELQLHQELSRAYLAACSAATGCVLCCIDNNGSSIENNILPLIRLIQNL